MSVQPDYYLPKHLDTPERFLFWSIEEAVAMIVPFMFGMMINQAFWGLVCSLLGFWGARKLKQQGDNIINQLVYWHFPHSKSLYRWLPPSHIREYLG